ncbi:MAG: sigma-70 family RNA polymerase sigma factor [Thermoanaerobaculia bacterium]
MGSRVDSRILIEGAQGGDRGALEQLLSRYLGTIRSQVAQELGAKLGERLEVDDLVQETLLQVYRSIAQYRGRSWDSFRRWLRVIATHVVQSQARRQRARKADFRREVSLAQVICRPRGEPVELGACLEASEERPSKELRRAERLDRLKKALNSLNPVQREVVTLVRLRGLPVKEVARKLGRTPNATSVLLLRALLRLKAAFGETDSFHLPKGGLEEWRSRDER